MANTSRAAGVNFSNTFQKFPVKANIAAASIASSGITHVKMFNYTQTDFFYSASQSGLKLVPGIPNDDLQALSTNDPITIKKVLSSLKSYAGIIDMIMVGNEPLINEPLVYGPLLLPALQNLKAALKTVNITAKLTVPFNSGIEKTSWPPSSGAFDPKLSSYITDVCTFLSKENSPFCINIYPYYARIGAPNDVPLDYCLFTQKTPQFTDPTTNLEYYNIFDAMYDATHFALKALKYDTLPIIVGECGWPTAGGMDASNTNAQTFNQNLITHVSSGTGTPKFPGQTIRTFVFEMYDEDEKSTAPGEFEKHWGVYEYQSGSDSYVAKYPLTWT